MPRIPRNLMKIFALAITAAAIAGAATAWTVRGWKSDAEIAHVQLMHTESVIKQTAAALSAYDEMESRKNAVIRISEIQSAQNRAAADSARAVAVGLHNDIARVPSRIDAATRAAVNEYAITTGELLRECAAQYQNVAAAADRHHTDARLIHDAWSQLRQR